MANNNTSNECKFENRAILTGKYSIKKYFHASSHDGFSTCDGNVCCNTL